MSKATKSNAKGAQAGTTVNPAPQPAANTAPARGESTATNPIVGSRDPQASVDAAAFEAQALAMLADSIEVGAGDDEGVVQLEQALSNEGATKPAAKRPAKPAAKPAAEVVDNEDDPDEVNLDAEASDVTEPSEGTATTEADGQEPVSDESTSDSDSSESDAADQDAEADAEPTADDQEPASAEEDGRKWPKSYLKRINKLTAKIETLEEKAQDAEILREENAKLKEQLETGGRVPALPVTSAEEALTNELSKLEQNIEFIEANPDGATVGEKTYTPEELRTLKRQFEQKALDVRLDLREAQRERKATAGRVEEALAKWHPDLADRKSPKRQAVDSLQEKYPVLKTDPMFKAILADAVAFRLQQAKQAQVASTKTATNGAPAQRVAPKPAPRPPGKPMAQPVAMSGRKVTADNAQKRFMETGDMSAGRDLIASLVEL